MRYYKAIFWRCLVPFLVYFTCVLYYLPVYCVEGLVTTGPHALSHADLHAEKALRYIILTLIAYFFFFEMVCIMRDGLDYLTDIFNWMDNIAFILNIYMIYATVYIAPDPTARTEVRAMAALTVVFMWFKAFYWLRIFSGTSFYVRLIRDTLYDIRYFMILFILILLTFANAIMILNEGRP